MIVMRRRRMNIGVMIAVVWCDVMRRLSSASNVSPSPSGKDSRSAAGLTMGRHGGEGG
jgi:hypothetical protein